MRTLRRLTHYLNLSFKKASQLHKELSNRSKHGNDSQLQRCDFKNCSFNHKTQEQAQKTMKVTTIIFILQRDTKRNKISKNQNFIVIFQQCLASPNKKYLGKKLYSPKKTERMKFALYAILYLLVTIHLCLLLLNQICQKFVYV